MYVCIYLQAYRKLDDMATKQTETLRKLTKQVSDLLENCCKTEKCTEWIEYFPLPWKNILRNLPSIKHATDYLDEGTQVSLTGWLIYSQKPIWKVKRGVTKDGENKILIQ